jgi:hypothetical protein
MIWANFDSGFVGSKGYSILDRKKKRLAGWQLMNTLDEGQRY